MKKNTAGFENIINYMCHQSSPKNQIISRHFMKMIIITIMGFIEEFIFEELSFHSFHSQFFENILKVSILTCFVELLHLGKWH